MKRRNPDQKYEVLQAGRDVMFETDDQLSAYAIARKWAREAGRDAMIILMWDNHRIKRYIRPDGETVTGFDRRNSMAEAERNAV